MDVPNQYDELRGAYSLAAFCRTYNVGLTFTYQQIKDNKLRAVKAGNKTLVLQRDAEAWARSLPEMRAAS
ncbi:MAG TPA: DNA-binding protein [Xanthobacteraceae bacterium]|nr:DNA-binding protein [Xanthobacteraceae bacterium]